jgi:predicted RNA binding protein YcfA (HicA-like mRNA interferase family)
MAHPDRDQMVPVPYHNRDIKAGTLSGILSSTGISRDELRKPL